MMRKGYQNHGKRWIVATGGLGIVFIIVGAILPYTGTEPSPERGVIPATSVMAEPAEIQAESAPPG